MTDLRMLVLTEDYVGACLCMSNCDNAELKAILDRAEQNNEDGIGMTLTEICEELFPQNTMVELGCTDEDEYSEITNLDTVTVAYSCYLTFSVVQSKTE